VPEPITILTIAGGWILGKAADGVAGGISDRVFQKALVGVKGRVGRLLGEERDVVAKAVRIAQIQALDQTIRDYREEGRPEWSSQPHTFPDNFFQRSHDFCERALARWGDPAFKIDLEVSAALEPTFGTVFGKSPPDDSSEREATVQAEDVVLEELRTELEGVRLPDGFEAHFRQGTETHKNFLSVFGGYLAEQLKNNDSFRVIVSAGQLFDISSDTSDIKETLACIDEFFGGSFDRLEQKLDARGHQLDALLAAVHRQNGVPYAALRSILKQLGERDVPDEEILTRLTAKADEIVALKKQLASPALSTPDLSAIRSEVLTQIERGDFEGPKRVLAEARRQISRQSQERSREEAELLSVEADIDRLQLNYGSAAERYKEAAELVRFDPESRFRFVCGEASARFALGSEFGDNGALRASIELWREAAQIKRRSESALDWAMTQSNLGIALATRGARERDADLSEEAVVAFRAALEERTRERVPLEWATTQNNLGNTLATLGARESGTNRLEQAIVAYRTALEERTRGRVPIDWAITQNNLGNALLMLGRRKSGTDLLEEAVVAYRAALEELTRERVPLEWATTQNGLGGALATLGGRESGTDRLKEAVDAYRAALGEFTRERVPLEWAATQHGLGSALRILGARESHTDRLKEAVVAYRAALKEHTRERVTLDWAATQHGLGSALATLGRQERDTGPLEQAVVAYRAALKERTRERVPLDWASTQSNLGSALSTLGEQERGTKLLEQALVAYRAALKEFTRDRAPRDWARIQRYLTRTREMIEKRRES
jgi:tetratricopeptide (TPR) repeat protein